TPLHLLGGRIERLGRLDARADLVALRFGGEEQEERGPGVEQVAILQQAFGKDHGLIVPGRIGEADDTHAISRLGASLDPPRPAVAPPFPAWQKFPHDWTRSPLRSGA